MLATRSYPSVQNCSHGTTGVQPRAFTCSVKREVPFPVGNLEPKE
jgi:hypothetical protein